ncbi:branched-chain amino acid ABC transporter permease, partial [Rhizobiaceae sp. 2RAB30]
MGTFADIFFGGLFQGSLYAMMAVGLALVWTTIGVFNFSHGVFMMLGAYLAWQFVSLGLPAVVAFPLAVIVMAGVG